MAVSQSFTGPTETDPELHLLPEREAITPRRLAPAAIGSIVFHITIVIMWATIPDAPFAHYGPLIRPDLNKSVKLYIPKDFELTQKDPNHGKISHELDIRSMRQAAQPSSPRLLPPSPPPGPIIQTPQPTPQPKPVPTVIQAAIPAEPPKPEAPKIEVPAAIAAVTAVAPKQTPPPEKPKLAFEDVGGAPPRTTPDPNRNVPLPKEAAVRPPTPAGGGGAIVGDIGQSSLTNPNALHAPSQGESKSNLQLLSDAKGVDFKPYLIQVLAAVRRNWLAIMPESARSGRRGRTVIQFAIDRSGTVPKVVIAEAAGTDTLDRAAVAAISAANPLPPLPTEYKGDQIRLQMAFSYNMPAR